MSKEKNTKEVDKKGYVSREEFEAFKKAVKADINELSRCPQTLEINKGE